MTPLTGFPAWPGPAAGSSGTQTGGGQAKAWNQHPEGTEALTKLKKIIKEELPQRSY